MLISVSMQLDTEEEFEAACREVTAKRKQAMSERCTARSPSLPVSDLDQPDGTVSLAEENKDDVPPMDTQFEDRRRRKYLSKVVSSFLSGSFVYLCSYPQQ